MSELKLIGKPAQRYDARDKALGITKYGADFVMPGMLHAKVLRSKYPSAKILSINTHEAERLPGVKAIITAKDVPYNERASNVVGQTTEIGAIQAIQPVLAKDRVRFLGEPIALIAAESLEIAEKATNLIKVDYEKLPVVSDPIEAMKPSSPLVHEGSNILAKWKIAKGDIEKGFKESDVIVENTYYTQFQDHAYMELEGGVAWIDNDEVINIRLTTQVIEHYRDVAKVLGVPESKIRVIGTFIGGGFGGKEDVTVETFLALLVQKTKKPVKLIYTREESILAHDKRHPFVMKYKTGAKKNGKLVALKAELVSDAGAYAYLSPWVLLYATVHASGPYDIPNIKVDSKTVYTNNIFTSAFRCFGGTQVCFAYESQMDELAHKLGMDSLKIREINYIKRGEKLPAGQRIESTVALAETASRAWKALEKPNKSKKGKRIGRGFASMMQSYGRLTMLHDSSHAWVGIEMDGSLIIRTGVPDLGGGQGSSLVQIASEILGIPGEDISIHLTDSSLTPLAGTTTATRQLYMSGNAVLQASRNLRNMILSRASQMLNVSKEELDLTDKKVIVKKGKKEIPLVDVVKEMAADGLPRNSFAMFNAPFSKPLNSEMEQYERVFPDFTFGTQAAEVEIDEETGKIKVTQLVSSYDVGRVVNRNSVEGQMEGGAVMGIGYALLEDIKSEKGIIQAKNLAQYLIPTSLDVPEVKTIILESKTGLGPFGAKGIGEPSMTPTAAAIANAIYDATGIRFTSLPITPEKIIMALKKKE